MILWNAPPHSTAFVLSESTGMLTVFHRSGLVQETTTEVGVVKVTIAVPEEAAEAEPTSASK